MSVRWHVERNQLGRPIRWTLFDGLTSVISRATYRGPFVLCVNGYFDEFRTLRTAKWHARRYVDHFLGRQQR